MSDSAKREEYDIAHAVIRSRLNDADNLAVENGLPYDLLSYRKGNTNKVY